jgi:hypothetical protein
MTDVPPAGAISPQGRAVLRHRGLAQNGRRGSSAGTFVSVGLVLLGAGSVVTYQAVKELVAPSPTVVAPTASTEREGRPLAAPKPSTVLAPAANAPAANQPAPVQTPPESARSAPAGGSSGGSWREARVGQQLCPAQPGGMWAGSMSPMTGPYAGAPGGWAMPPRYEAPWVPGGVDPEWRGPARGRMVQAPGGGWVELRRIYRGPWERERYSGPMMMRRHFGHPGFGRGMFGGRGRR